MWVLELMQQEEIAVLECHMSSVINNQNKNKMKRLEQRDLLIETITQQLYK